MSLIAHDRSCDHKRRLCQHSECQHVHAHGDCKQQSNVWDYSMRALIAEKFAAKIRIIIISSTILVRVIFLIVTLLNNVKVAFHFRVSKSEKNLQNKQE